MRRQRGQPGARPPAIWRAGERRASLAARARGHRGQSLVEFALVVPLFLLILFGVVEYALINASVGAFNFAAKEGARYEAIIGNGQSPSPYQATPLDQYVVNYVIVPQVAGVVMAQMQEVVVYKALQTGGCAGTGTITGSIPNCQSQVTLLPGAGGVWTITSNSWQSLTRNDQLSNADYLGVFISYQYTYLTAFFAIASPTINLSAISVQRIEPQQYGDSGQSQPVAQVGGGAPAASNPFSAALDLLGFAIVLPRRRFGLIAGVRI